MERVSVARMAPAKLQGWIYATRGMAASDSVSTKLNSYQYQDDVVKQIREKTLETLIRCPGCGEKCAWQNNPHRPFCSERCRTIDLGQWATEGYAIAGKPVPVNEEDPNV